MEQLPTIDDYEEFRGLETHLDQHTTAHSDVQINVFMIGLAGEGHPWGMYQQCLRELDSRKSRMVGCLHSRRTFELDRVDQEIAVDDANTKPPGRRRELALARANLELEMIALKVSAEDTRIQSILRETRVIRQRADELLEELQSQMGHPGTALTADEVTAFDGAFWVHSLKIRAALASLQGQMVPKDIMQIVPLMEGKDRMALRSAITNPDAVLGHMGYTDAIPSPMPPDRSTLRLRGM